MKLLARYSRINVAATIMIFLVASTALFLSLRYILIDQIDSDLRIEEQEIQLFVDKHGRLPEALPVEDQLIEFSHEQGAVKRLFRTVMLTDPKEGDREKFRQLQFGVHDAAGWHRVLVSKSLEQTDELVATIFSIALLTILFILLASFLLNRWAVKRIWKPFYTALDALRGYKISEGKKLRLPASGVDEFESMNQEIMGFASQASTDYLSLKTFSENATHELQTPIAIIRSKLDLLQQETALSPDGAQALQGAYNSLQRLSRINDSLLLLARIENNQFAEKESFDMAGATQKKLEEFRELFQEKSIRISTTLRPAPVWMNGALAEILLNNLLSNALRYSQPEGEISISTEPGSLSISNSSDAPAMEESDLFRRFQRAHGTSGTAGLGLALVKQICDASGFSIRYNYGNGMHTFLLSWS